MKTKRARKKKSTHHMLIQKNCKNKWETKSLIFKDYWTDCRVLLKASMFSNWAKAQKLHASELWLLTRCCKCDASCFIGFGTLVNHIETKLSTGEQNMEYRSDETHKRLAYQKSSRSESMSYSRGYKSHLLGLSNYFLPKGYWFEWHHHFGFTKLIFVWN